MGALAGAFYAGRKYKGPVPFLDPGEPLAQPSPAPTVAPGPAAGSPEAALLAFEQARSDVDKDPNVWLTTRSASELTRQGIQNPLDSTEPTFLYLYGRASLLTEVPDQAAKAFEAAIAKSDLNPTPANAAVRKEATFGLAAVALLAERERPVAQRRLEELLRKPPVPSPTIAASPAASPLSSP